jgi:hypothetical protein
VSFGGLSAGWVVSPTPMDGLARHVRYGLVRKDWVL